MKPEHRAGLHEPGVRGLFRNSVLVALGQGTAALLFVVYVLAARLLGDVRYGEFSLGMTIALVLFTLPAWGTSRYASILAARDPERTHDILSPSLGLTGCLGLIYLPLVWAVAATMSGSRNVVGVSLVLGVDLLARDYAILLRLLMRVHGAFALDAASVFVERCLMVAGGLLVLFLFPDPILLAAAFCGGRVVGSVVTGMLYGQRVGPIRVSLDVKALKRILVGGAPIAMRRGIADLSFRVDTLLLGAFRSTREVGWYSSVYRLMDGGLMLPGVISGSLAPTLSANFAEGKTHVVNRLYQRGTKYLLLAGLFAAALFVILAEPVVQILYGSEYAPAADALRLLAPALLFIFLRRHATEVLDNVDRRSATVWIFGGALACNVLLNVLLIPQYGYVGAAAAKTLCEGYLAAAMIRELHRAGYSVTAALPLRSASIAIAMSVLTMWMLAAWPLLALSAAAIVYAAGLTLLGVWDEKDMMLVRSIVQPRR